MTSRQDLFLEINTHLMQDEFPSRYLTYISNIPLFGEYPFLMLKVLKETNQSPKYHPEGNVWNHTMMVLDAAAKVKDKSSDKRSFLWAALLHDIGKPDTTKLRNGRITSYNHEKIGAKLADKFLREFSEDEHFIQRVSALVRWHMQILFVINNPSFCEIETMKEQTDVNEVALLGFCDRLGRLGADEKKEIESVNRFIERCNKNDSSENREIRKDKS